MISASFTCSYPARFRSRLMGWLSQYDIAAFFDSNHFTENIIESRYDWLAACGSRKIISTDNQFFESLQKDMDINPRWWVGFLGYDLKNETEKLVSENEDRTGFPRGFFFQPETIISCKGDEITVSILPVRGGERTKPEKTYRDIEEIEPYKIKYPQKLAFARRTGKDQYIANTRSLLNHIMRGDIYEVNYCQEFYCDGAVIDPLSVFMILQDNSPAPFSFYFRISNRYIISASPERYLHREGNRLSSQPMKGTAPRGASHGEDESMKSALEKSEKEASENIMIVDLVRNDLSRFATRGSVNVDELAGLYSFSRVHQLVSTVSCSIPEEVTVTQMIMNTFPMGSMTGAPKIRAMELIERYEDIRRGAFSGAAGYIMPGGNFDFNVIIRSFMYDSAGKYLSIMAGSAITALSDPEKEYEECLLKAGYAIEAIGGKI